jgi:hypothetical protein
MHGDGKSWSALAEGLTPLLVKSVSADVTVCVDESSHRLAIFGSQSCPGLGLCAGGAGGVHQCVGQLPHRHPLPPRVRDT